jgi:hypothetical protein
MNDSSDVSVSATNLKIGLAVAGAIAGAVIGVVITVVGKVVAEAPPATLANYARNMIAFGGIGAITGPLVTWSALRRVPLWRTVVEPLVGAAAGAVIGMFAGPVVTFLILAPVGAALAVGRLAYVYRERAPQLPSKRPE